ncbi:hypothetical protein evm_008390 [Chilo suppressalis]|nr:hypothetical protein evm_008390 [Chilo suppressalis]
MKRENTKLSSKTSRHCCEDHFDLETDMENYFKFKLVGGKLQLKKGVLPHKFECQKLSTITIVRSGYKKRQDKEYIQQILCPNIGHDNLLVVPVEFEECKTSKELCKYIRLFPANEDKGSELKAMPDHKNKAVQVNIKVEVKTKSTGTPKRRNRTKRTCVKETRPRKCQVTSNTTMDNDPKVTKQKSRLIISSLQEPNVKEEIEVDNSWMVQTPDWNQSGPNVKEEKIEEGEEMVEVEEEELEDNNRPNVKEEQMEEEEEVENDNGKRQIEIVINNPSFTRQNPHLIISPISGPNVKVEEMEDKDDNEEVEEEEAEDNNVASATSTPTVGVKPPEKNAIKAKLFYKKLIVTEKMAQIINISTLLQYSNITPFRRRKGFRCFYCSRIFDNWEKLKDHTTEHNKSESRNVLRRFGVDKLIVYVDISNLCCTICDASIPNLNELKCHLSKEHQKKMHLEFNDRVIPFNLTPNDGFLCPMCDFSFASFGAIESHMNEHFKNYICKDCGMGFPSLFRLKVHFKIVHVKTSFPCKICQKRCKSLQELKSHIATGHNLVKPVKCTFCSERFTNFIQRQKHVAQQHGGEPPQYNCDRILHPFLDSVSLKFFSANTPLKRT